MSCYTGSMFETEVLAECIFSWDNYVPFMKCVELVKANQPRRWNPSRPPTISANVLQYLVAEALGLSEDRDQVKLYTALRSPLDRFHGVDCFVEYNNKIATIDLTVNPHKDSYKADFVLSENDTYDEEGKINRSALRLKAQAIARRLVA